MSKSSINFKKKSEYIENDTVFHRFKRRLTYSKPLSLIKKYKKSHKNLTALDVGIGSGYFMYSFKKTFPSGQITGVEYDSRNIEYAKKITGNLDIHQGNAEDFNLNTKYDVISSFQVIEHLYNPGNFLKNIKKHLDDDGIAIITTPNLHGNGASYMGDNWSGYREDHISLKGFDEWIALIKSQRFEILYAGSTFFSGIPIMNKLPFAIINWFFLLVFGSLKWKKGESFICVFKNKK